MTQVSRIAERVKRLHIERQSDTLVGFRASLEDRSEDPDGGELIHSLTLQGTISLPDLVIRSIEPHSVHQPYEECLASLEPARQLVGLKIGPGFRAKVQELMGRTRGCTHFLSLVLDLAAAHTLTTFLRMREQALSSERNAPNSKWMKVGLSVEPRLENACIALTSDSRIIRQAKQPS